MGSVIEINDTLKLSRGEGFPATAVLGGHYDFRVAGVRLFHLKPVRVFLVEEVDGLWDYVGHAQILELTINAVTRETSGRFEITLLYPRDNADQRNVEEAPPGRAYRKRTHPDPG